MFSQRLAESVLALDSACSVGLDPSSEFIPEEFFNSPSGPSGCSDSELADAYLRFALAVIDAVAGIVPVLKPQAAFFEELGVAGVAVLDKVVSVARSRGLLVVLDAKRGDVPNTARAYARAYLSSSESRGIQCDAMTINPYLGLDGIEPFVECAISGKGVFVCVKTSNPGSKDVQDLRTEHGLVYESVAELLRPSIRRAKVGSLYSNVGFVVGGQHPDAAAELRRRFPDVWFLVPGLGAQGASAEDLAPFFGPDGMGALVSSSRSVLYPHKFGGAPRWSPAAVRDAAREVNETVNQVRGRK